METKRPAGGCGVNPTERENLWWWWREMDQFESIQEVKWTQCGDFPQVVSSLNSLMTTICLQSPISKNAVQGLHDFTWHTSSASSAITEPVWASFNPWLLISTYHYALLIHFHPPSEMLFASPYSLEELFVCSSDPVFFVHVAIGTPKLAAEAFL